MHIPLTYFNYYYIIKCIIFIYLLKNIKQIILAKDNKILLFKKVTKALKEGLYPKEVNYILTKEHRSSLQREAPMSIIFYTIIKQRTLPKRMTRVW